MRGMMRLAIMGVPGASRGGVDPVVAELLTLFAGIEDGEVAIENVDSSIYHLRMSLPGGRCWTVRLNSSTFAGDATIHVLGTSKTQYVWQSVDDADPSVTKGGGSWSSSPASTLGGTYAYTNSAGRYAEYTTPEGVIHIGVRAFTSTVGGMWLVTIDGDPTKANLLPTAQQLVDAEVLVSTALVANGGTLNPTDRICDSYATSGASSADWRINFARDLEPGAHTIRIAHTGYKNVSATEARVMFTGFTFSHVTANLSGNYLLFEDEETQLGSSHEYEYALNCLPTGATTSRWIGNGHGYDAQTALTFTVDGQAVTPANGEMEVGTTVIVTRTSQMTHLDIAPAKVADVSTVYTLTTAEGLQIDWTITWALAGTMTSDPIAMYPVDNKFDAGANAAAPQTIVALTANNDAFVLNGKSQAIYAWDVDGVYGHLLYIKDLASVENWANEGTYFAFAVDYNSPLINKLYAYRNASGFAASEVWTCSTQRRIQRFADGANAALSAVSG